MKQEDIFQSNVTDTSKAAYRNDQRKKKAYSQRQMVIKLMRAKGSLCVRDISILLQIDNSSAAARLNEVRKGTHEVDGRLYQVLFSHKAKHNLTGMTVNYYEAYCIGDAKD